MKHQENRKKIDSIEVSNTFIEDSIFSALFDSKQIDKANEFQSRIDAIGNE